MSPRSHLDVPDDWERVSTHKTGPFATSETLRRPDGSVVTWQSRPWRKGRRDDAPGSIWWQPRRLGWWIAVLFAIGATCFLVAAIAAQVSTNPGDWILVTFFVGSIFFTSAAYCQFSEAVNVRHDPMPGRPRERFRPVSWEPGRIDWLASSIQLAGTIFFNVSTFAAMQKGLDTTQINRRVWAPDALGSICFLLASELAFAEVCHRWFAVQWGSLSWWIVALNLAGSVAFGIAAIASLVEPSTGEPVSAAIANIGTAVGALGFLVGAVLLVPESMRSAEAAPAVPEQAVPAG
jgi:hypothetical protein